jgi:hypothetical protein
MASPQRLKIVPIVRVTILFVTTSTRESSLHAFKASHPSLVGSFVDCQGGAELMDHAVLCEALDTEELIHTVGRLHERRNVTRQEGMRRYR